MLNLDRLSGLDIPFPPEEGARHAYYIDLSTEIRVEKREVLSLPSLFGEIGGLNDFLATIIVFLIGTFQAKAFSFDRMTYLFRVSINDGPSILKADASSGDVSNQRKSFLVLKL